MITMSEIKMVRVGDIRRPRYQRQVKEIFVRKIVKVFDEREVGTPVLSYEDGVYYVIDGLQRTTIVERVYGPDHELRCEVHHGLTEEEARQIYLETNTFRTRVSAYEKFMGSLDSGAAVETHISEILARHGQKVGPGHDCIRACAALYIIYGAVGSSGSPELLDRVIATASSIYGDPDQIGHNAFIRGLAYVYRFRPEIRDKELIKKVSAFGTVHQLIGTSRGPVGGSSIPLRMANVLIEIYNKGHRDHNRIMLVGAQDTGHAASEQEEDTQ